ncbi:MAG: hypothetical protein PHE55_20770 [Methylococcaceae bacterium]|nr:hypothetical protein [Methylococcaceae bacterium]
MAGDSTITFTIRADTAQSKAAIEGFTRSLAQTGPAAEKSVSSFRQFEEGLNRRVAQTAKYAAAAAVLAMAGIAAASVKMAVNAVESENLFEVSMGRMGGAARAWSEEVSAALGLNAFEVRKSIGTFNVMLSSMGLAEQSAYDMAKGLTQLSYDMASFYNLKPAEAFQKLQSGITGEIEPLKRLGIVVNENTTKQIAYAEGIAKVDAELTEAQKIQARYIGIMNQTALAQGDLARTIDSPANAMRILQSRSEQLMIQLGTALIPTLQGVIMIMGDLIRWLQSGAENLHLVAKAALLPIQAFQLMRAGIYNLIALYYEYHTAIMTVIAAQSLMAGQPIAAYYAIKAAMKDTQKEADEYAAANLKVKDEIFALEDAVARLGIALGMSSVPAKNLATDFDKLREAAKKIQNKIKKLLETMVEQAATFGKSQAQTELYRLEILGATTGQLEFAAAVAATIAHLTAEEERTKTIQTTMKGLMDQASTFGMSEKAIAIHQLRMAGATEGEIAFAQAVQASVREMTARKAAVDALQKGTDDYQESMNQLVLSIHAEQTEAQKIQEQLDLLTEGWKAGTIALTDYEDKVAILNLQLDELHLDETTEHLRSLNDSAYDFGRQMSTSFTQMIIYGKGFGDVMKSLLVLIAEAIVKAYVFKSIAGSLSGSSGFLGILGSFFGGLAGISGGVTAATSGAEAVIPAGGGGFGAFQEGGRPPMNQVSLVGERGPEWWVPDRPGTIVPIGGGRSLKPTTVINNYIDARGADAAVEYRVLRAQRVSEARAVNTARLQMQQAALRS